MLRYKPDKIRNLPQLMYARHVFMNTSMSQINNPRWNLQILSRCVHVTVIKMPGTYFNKKKIRQEICTLFRFHLIKGQEIILYLL